MKWLITSVGSLIGQNVLDVLDYPGFPRRGLVSVVGTNSLAECTGNFRCDRCHLLPPTADPDFRPALRRVLIEERPDLILAGRDQDTVVLGRMKEDEPDLPGAFPYGSSAAMQIGFDKWETWLFAQRHGLPVAETCRPRGDLDVLRSFAQRVGFPLVAKPRHGFASKGVFFARDMAEATTLAALPDHLFQEYLGRPEALEPYFQLLAGPPPLFAHPPEVSHYTCQTVIGPGGEIAPFFISHNRHDSGRTVGFQRVDLPDLHALSMEFARALRAEGGAGPAGIQFRHDREGRWKAQEINLRTNGNTFPRFLMGQDELHMIVSAFLPGADFPEWRGADPHPEDSVIKDLNSVRVRHADLRTLERHGVWPGPTD